MSGVEAHDSHVPIEATRRPADTPKGARLGLSNAFLSAMFLDDVCVLTGNTAGDSVDCFRKCLASSGALDARVFDAPESKGRLHRETNPNTYETETAGACAKRTLDEIAEDVRGAIWVLQRLEG